MVYLKGLSQKQFAQRVIFVSNHIFRALVFRLHPHEIQKYFCLPGSLHHAIFLLKIQTQIDKNLFGLIALVKILAIAGCEKIVSEKAVVRTQPEVVTGGHHAGSIIEISSCAETHVQPALQWQPVIQHRSIGIGELGAEKREPEGNRMTAQRELPDLIVKIGRNDRVQAVFGKTQ